MSTFVVAALVLVATVLEIEVANVAVLASSGEIVVSALGARPNTLFTSTQRELLDLHWHTSSTRTRALVKYQLERREQNAARDWASKSKVSLVVWSQATPVWFGDVHKGHTNPSCRISCEVSFDRDQATSADALVMMLDRPESPLPSNHPPWIGITWENLMGHQRYKSFGSKLRPSTSVEAQLDASLIRGLRPDLLVSHELDADIPFPYPQIRTFVERFKTQDRVDVSARVRNQRRGIYVLISNGDAHILPDRLKLLKAVQRAGFPVASYGKAMLDPYLRQEFLKLDNAENREGAGLELQGSYLFSNAIENSFGVDYVTEKLYLALTAGAVPLYLGAPNIVDFLPDRDAVIHVNDFETPDDLARYLDQLSGDLDLLIDRHHAWRFREKLPQLLTDISLLAPSSLTCALCEAAADLRS
ncbi:Alpha-1,3-fucosyltransferase 11 [Hondaea fermentalgiana]|uniref:Fucosyltransferase n=1 Tax=Hondaea fermentalgiana TaxID=2315210 RepID=A0A2R5GM40_9STRA|nr:Alpha-1,3-fucosyltransferase 11 [Hondaea fermentalgiana]|eukprot:GBG31947.1 Alpha-1,3-fucosyltransferase 11 [Hondaea fermentalgiana]